jgi:hypothetical protein
MGYQDGSLREEREVEIHRLRDRKCCIHVVK